MKQKVKDHIQRNRKFYMSATYGAAVGAIAAFYILSKTGAIVFVDGWKIEVQPYPTSQDLQRLL